MLAVAMLSALNLSFVTKMQTSANYRIAVPGIKSFSSFPEKILGVRVVYATVEKPSASVEAASAGAREEKLDGPQTGVGRRDD